jgi:hypothetical protein
LETPGYYSFSEIANQTAESTDALDATISSFIDTENLIKKNFLMKPEKREDFANSNPEQQNLRG